MTVLELSTLPHTWFIDLDGTVFAHNGHKTGEDTLLPGCLAFWESLPKDDHIVLLTARTQQEAPATIEALQRFGLRYHQILFDLPTGERVLINDQKPSGLLTAHAINVTRDSGLTDIRPILNTDL